MVAFLTISHRNSITATWCGISRQSKMYLWSVHTQNICQTCTNAMPPA